MAESRVFQKVNGITVDGIGRSVQNFLRSSKGLVVQGGKAGEGYVVQAKDDDGWKQVSGMASAIEVQISDTGNGILVNIGNAQWSDKIGAGVIGWFVFAPLAVTAIVGTVQQQKLPGEIFAHIERYVASGGKDMYIGGNFVNASAGHIICPHCQSEVPAGQSFCSSCGKPLTKQCPGCGENIPLNLDFCPKCGANTKLPKTIRCIACGASLPAESAFCISCGTKQPQQQIPQQMPQQQMIPQQMSPQQMMNQPQQMMNQPQQMPPQQMYQPPQQMYQQFPQGFPCNKCGFINAPDDSFCKQCGAPLRNNAPNNIPDNAPVEIRQCPKCGRKLKDDDVFCSGCGEKLDVPPPEPEKLICPECNAELEADSKFCSKCGYKF